MYKKERKSMLELSNDSRNLQYQLKGIGISCDFHGGFWCEYVYLNTAVGPVAWILSNDSVAFMDKSWYNNLNEAEKYLVDEFIDYCRRYM